MQHSCKYVYKACSQPRSVKKNGRLHNLCVYHRAKANAVQKIYASKRRTQKEQRAESFDVVEVERALADPHLLQLALAWDADPSPLA
ncbi:hypothetical protein ACHHYP_08723 [Achlya hypogyna]|uniref:Uncharacterized protein n=1 Tax=Achlya hypogyna TaxID=1202772 RepID=A0A1V9ZK53_ACHHY|nr:hypothetical protein ACHHYP_08723 [Achlya hypogyna]